MANFSVEFDGVAYDVDAHVGCGIELGRLLRDIAANHAGTEFTCDEIIGLAAELDGGDRHELIRALGGTPND